MIEKVNGNSIFVSDGKNRKNNRENKKDKNNKKHEKIEKKAIQKNNIDSNLGSKFDEFA